MKPVWIVIIFILTATWSFGQATSGSLPLVDAGWSAYKAAEEKNVPALAAIAGPLDASCTSCHKEYRPNVFPRQGGSQ